MECGQPGCSNVLTRPLGEHSVHGEDLFAICDRAHHRYTSWWHDFLDWPACFCPGDDWLVSCWNLLHQGPHRVVIVVD